MEATRDFLRGKQTRGEVCIEASGYTGSKILMRVGGALFNTANEANAALYAESHNVANRTGMWPEDLVARVKELEAQKKAALERLTMACASDMYNRCPPMIREWLYVARAILNKPTP